MPNPIYVILTCLVACVATLIEAAPSATEHRSASESIYGDDGPDSPGKQVYQQICATCHEAGVPKAPTMGMLQFMSPNSIYYTLTEGVMSQQVGFLTEQQRLDVVKYLTGRAPSTQTQQEYIACDAETAQFDWTQPPTTQGWGITNDNRRAFTNQQAGITRANVNSLKVKWAFAFPDAVRARSHPVAGGGAVFVGSQDGRVYAFDQQSGCVRWAYRAKSEVRTGIVLSTWTPDDDSAQPTLYFGDYIGNLYAVDAVNGKELWRARPDDHQNATLTAAPVLHNDRLFVPVSSLEVASPVNSAYPCCTFRGSVVAYDAKTGEQLWKTFTIDDPAAPQDKNAAGTQLFGPSGAPIWNTPAIDEKRNQLYVGTGENYSSPANDRSDAIFAIDLDDGTINWVFQATRNDAWNVACEVKANTGCPKERGPDYDFGAATILTTDSMGRDTVLAGQKSGMAWALNPDTGRVLWNRRVSFGGLVGGIHFGMATSGDALFVPITDELRSVFHPKTEKKPGVYALDIKTGDYLWSWRAETGVCGGKPNCGPGNGAAIVTTPELVFAGSLDGFLRAHDTRTGEVIWKFDTAREFPTATGAVAKGGAMEGGASALLVDGMLFLNSGYLFNPNMPGNLFIALEVAQ